MPRRPLLAALLTVPLVALAAQAAGTFRDIPSGHWALVPASVLADRRIMVGRTPVDFAGEVPLTRYELAQILSALYIESGPPATFLVLKDMPPGHEATRDVQRVLGYGLLETGRGGTFGGEALVTRGELAEALDTLLEKNGVAPPTRRRQTVYFSDVPQGSPLFKVLDRVVNRFGLIEARAGSAFIAVNPVTRFQVLSILVKALPYLNPAVERELQEALAPPSPGPASPGPTANPRVSPGASPLPLAGAPPLLRSRGRLQGELIAMLNEDLPRQTGAVVANEPAQFSGGMLAGGGVSGEHWTEAWGLALGVNTMYVGFDIPDQGQPVPIDMLDTGVSGIGYWRVGGGPDWEAAVGGGVMARQAFNVTGQLVSQYYLSADKTSVGAGPAATLAFRAGPGLELIGTALVGPMAQWYNLPRPNGPQTLTRIGTDLTGRALYQVAPGWTLDAGVHAFLSTALGGGSLTTLGLTAGVTKDF
ncbi:MAG: S-layer homology domain-containing protein [Candidatus Sericytochromatia bacterium]|nr:S-layer homology domain-containing protein [Candidatus Sericytochromatia bacterium]